MLLGKIKLYDIAKEFDMSSKDILAIAVKLNIDAKSHLSSVSDEDAERIRKEAKNTNKTKQNNVKKDSKKLADSKGATPVIIRREVIVEDTTKKSAIPEKKEERKSNNVGFVERKNKDFNIVYRNKPSKPMTFDELFGKKKEDKKEEGRYLRREFSYTRFQQAMILPDDVVKEKIQARMEHGVLTIDIPKQTVIPEEKNGRTIEIK